MLLAGEIDAGIAIAGLDPHDGRPVIADPMAASRAWFAGTAPTGQPPAVPEGRPGRRRSLAPR